MGGWEEVELIKHIKFIDYRGKTPKKIPEGMRLITAKNVKMDRLNLEPQEFVAPEIYEDWMTRGIPQKGDVLFTTEAPLGNVAQLDTDAKVVFAQRIITFQPDRSIIDPSFLKFMLLSGPMQKRIHERATGATAKGIKSSLLKKILLPLPPLPEQKRIVAILDKSFASIDKAIANTEKNLANARELFESYLNGVFSEPGEGWEERKLAEVLTVQPRNGWSPPAKFHSDSGTPVLTLSAVTGFQFKRGMTKHTSAESNPDAHYWINNEDLLITRSNTPELVGHVAIVAGIEKPTIYPDLIMRMVVNSEIVHNKFVYYQLRSAKLREIITTSATGANPTMKKIKKSVVQDLPIAHPCLKKQETIVKQLNAVKIQSEHLESIYQQKLTNLQDLKQSILQKAFAGEL